MAEFASTDALRSAFTSESMSRHQSLDLVGNFSVEQLELVFDENAKLLLKVETLLVQNSELAELPDVFARLENCDWLLVRDLSLIHI